MKAYFISIIGVLAFLYSLRPSTMPISASGQTLTQLQDQLWDSLESSKERTSSAFGERFGSAFEAYPGLVVKLANDIKTGALATQASTPFLGEPLEIAGVLRRFPDIRRISVSAQIAEQGELYQRLFEGLYPVLVSEGGAETYRLVTPAEVGTCEIVATAKEAQLVRCP